MKKILILLLVSSSCMAQDSTKLVNVKVQVRLAASWMNLLTSDDDLYFDIRKADKLAASPALVDSISIDTMLVTDVVKLYDLFYGYSYSIGSNVIKWMQDHFAVRRTQNSNLDTQMTAIETKWNNVFIGFRGAGLIRQRRKN